MNLIHTGAKILCSIPGGESISFFGATTSRATRGARLIDSFALELSRFQLNSSLSLSLVHSRETIYMNPMRQMLRTCTRVSTCSTQPSLLRFSKVQVSSQRMSHILLCFFRHWPCDQLWIWHSPFHSFSVHIPQLLSPFLFLFRFSLWIPVPGYDNKQSYGDIQREIHRPFPVHLIL